MSPISPQEFRQARTARGAASEIGELPRETDRPTPMISVGFWALVAVTTLIRILYLGREVIDLSPDEAHYWEWSRRPDLSYYSKGPLVAYIIYVGTRLLGNTPLGVRIGAMAISVLTAWLLFVFARELAGDDGRTGLYTVSVLQAVPLFAAGSILMTIDPPFLLFWLLAMICIWRGVHGRPLYWLLAGGAAGLGLLAKYTMIFIVPSVLLYFLLAPQARHWLWRREPYLASLLALAIFAQVLIWNALNNWVSFRHTASRAPGEGLGLAHAIEFLAGQLGVLSPLIALGIAYGVWWGWRNGIGARQEPARFLMSFFLPLFGFAFFLSFRSKIQANWPAAVYIPGALLAVLALRDRWDTLAPSGRRWMGGVVAGSILLGVAVTVIAHDTSLLNRLGLTIPPKLDPTVRLKGWRELGERVTQLKGEMEARNRVFLLSDRYQVTSELAFYVSGQPAAYNVNFGRRLNQYDLWGGSERLLGWDAIYVVEGEQSTAGPLTASFTRIDSPEWVRVKRSGQLIRTFSIFRCHDFRGLPQPSGPAKF